MTVIHCGDGEPPDGALSYETLIAEHRPVEDARRGGDELLGVFYTGGTTGSPQGRDAHARQPARFVDRRLASGHFITPRGRSAARRADVPSRRHRGMGRGTVWSAPPT